MTSRSVVEFFSEHEGYRCGYCGQKDTNYSRGMWAHLMTVEDYQDLIDRGWRRSGKYLYKPTMKKTCCPHYTIKCDALKFKLNKSHKKVIKAVNKFLNDDTKRREGEKDGPSTMESEPHSDPTVTRETTQENKEMEPQPNDKSKDIKEKTSPRPGVGADPSKPLCRKAKELRLERRKQKMEAKSKKETNSVDQTAQSKKTEEAKSLEDFLFQISENPAHRLELRLVRSSPQSEEFEATFKESYEVYKKYQIAIHHDPPGKPSARQFTRFLVESPLEPSGKMGSYHQQYVLDGRIVAVGVIDVLPHCVSSVYLYYDPDVSFLSLGTYSALRELAFVRQLQEEIPSIIYYYMGYYIHSCPKMKYKGQYKPSYLACPESYKWVPIEDCTAKLDASRYARLSDANAVDENGDFELSQVLVLFHRQAMPYMIYSALSEADDEEEVQHYAKLTGKTCAQRMLLYRA